MRSTGRALPLTIATAFLMEGLDSSVVTTALPAMAHDLATSTPALAVTVTSYLVSLAVFMPLGGWLANRYGARQVFISALGIFALGSLLCGLAPDRGALILGRIVQGIGGAMMSPVGRAILISSVPKSEYIHAMNYVIMPGLIGPAVGPLVGGFLATYVSWHWIFLINLPLAALGIAMSVRFIAPAVIESEVQRSSLDWLGYAYLIVALGMGQWAIEMSSHGAPSSAASAAALSIVGFMAFFRRYQRRGSGVLNLDLLRIRTFRLSVTAGSVARAGLGGIPFLLPLLLQLGFGYDAFHSGLVTFLIAVGSAAIRPILSVLMRWMGCRRLLLANSLATAAGTLGFLLFRDKAGLWLIGPYVFMFGLLRSIQMSTMNALSYTDMEKRDMAAASTIATLAQRLSIGLGVNIAAVVLAQANGSTQPGLGAFALAFCAAASLLLIAGAMFLRLRPTDGWQISARNAPDAAEQLRRERPTEAGPTDV
jgi:EmrB/QacA subfamily drug resistance transporter